MHISAFDHYQTGTTIIHRLDPRMKFIALIFLVVSNLLLPDGAWLGFALSFLVIMLSGQTAKISLKFLIMRSYVALPFALASITVLFSIHGGAEYPFALGGWEFTVSEAGILRFLSIMIRSLISVLGAILLTATTRFPALVHALRHLRFPAILVGTISIMYRFLFVLSDETIRMLRAREARSASRAGWKSGRSVLWRARVVGNMVGQLFIRSYERSERIYSAMQARGYRGILLTMHPHVLIPLDWGFIFITLCLLSAIQVIGRI